MSQVNFNVSGDHGDDIPYLLTDNPPGGIRVDGAFEGPGRMIITAPPAITGAGTVFYQGGAKHFRIIIPPEIPLGAQWEAGLPPCIPPEYNGDVEQVALHYAPLDVPLPVLAINGQYLSAGSERWTAIESSDFAAYARFLAGEDLTPVLTQRSGLGFNLLRVWLLNTSVYRIVPSDWGSAFYARLPEFSRLCARLGLYVEFTCCTQTQTLMPSKEAQQAHLDQIGAALEPVRGQVLLSKVNEADQWDNRTAEGLRMPDGFLCSQGSNGADAEPPTPTLQYEEYHSNGLSEWWRKTGHNSMEWADIHRSRCLGGENTRMPDQDDSPTHAYDAAAGAALLCLGACFHSVHGKTSELWSGRELECAAAWADGARSVPLEFQPGAYQRLENPSPDILRVYRRVLTGGRFHEVRIRA